MGLLSPGYHAMFFITAADLATQLNMMELDKEDILYIGKDGAEDRLALIYYIKEDN